MRFVSIIDTRSQAVITVDADSLIFRLEIDGSVRETRLKTYYAEILYLLFNKHPAPTAYEEITNLLKARKIIITDSTRMHRKLSEIRLFLQAFHPSLGDLILNTRAVGYSLPLRLKNIHQLEGNAVIKFKNPKIAENIQILCALINDAIMLASEENVILHAQGYVIDRDKCRQILVEKIASFNNAIVIILEELRVHEADFTGIRVQYLLAKLRTYVGLARISEYPISNAQWLDWFKQEVWAVFDDLQKLIKLAESL